MVRELGFLTKSFDSAAPTPGFCQDRFRVSAKFDEKHVKRGGGGGGGGCSDANFWPNNCLSTSFIYHHHE